MRMRRADGTTHWEGCEQEHHGCALTVLAQARSELEEVRGAPAQVERTIKRAEQAEAALARVRAAAKIRVEHGHNDTCDQALSAEYSCTCGHDMLRAALEGR